MHSIPPNEQQFSISPDYINSIMIVPLIIFFISVSILLLFLFYVFGRFLKGKYCPNTKILFLESIKETSSTYWEPDFQKRKYHYRYSIFAFFLFLFVGFTVNALVFVGSVQVTTSLQTTSQAFFLAAIIFFGLAYLSTELGIGLNNITDIANSFPCNKALLYSQNNTLFQTYTETSASFSSLIVDLAKSIGEFVQNAGTTTETIGIQDKDIIISVYFVSMTIVLGLFIAAYFAKSKEFFTVMILFSALLVFFLIAIHCIFLFLLVCIVILLLLLFLMN